MQQCDNSVTEFTPNPVTIELDIQSTQLNSTSDKLGLLVNQVTCQGTKPQ